MELVAYTVLCVAVVLYVRMPCSIRCVVGFRQYLTGDIRLRKRNERGGGKLYDGEKACLSINHSVLPGGFLSMLPQFCHLEHAVSNCCIRRMSLQA
jgi:hypothetical protein